MTILQSRPCPGRDSLKDWAHYTKLTRHPATQRSAGAAHAAIDKFVAWVGAKPITERLLLLYVDHLRGDGNSPSTINTKLSYIAGMLSAMPFEPKLQIPYVTRQKHRRWWLTDDAWLDLREWVASADGLRQIAQPALLIAYLDWTRETGLRVEETLRLLPSDFVDDYYSLIPPGTKTPDSSNIIAISDKAREIAMGRIAKLYVARTLENKRLFDVNYRDLRAMWEACREHMGVADNPTATLKALRRTFAANCLLNKGMDAVTIKDLMRHADLNTTMGYLHLVGLAAAPQVRAKLNSDFTDADREDMRVRIAGHPFGARMF